MVAFAQLQGQQSMEDRSAKRMRTDDHEAPSSQSPLERQATADWQRVRSGFFNIRDRLCAQYGLQPGDGLIMCAPSPETRQFASKINRILHWALRLRPRVIDSHPLLP